VLLVGDVLVTIGDVTVPVIFFVTRNANYDALLGIPWQCAVNAVVTNSTDGKVTYVITDPIIKEKSTFV
jgi:hypothetical protein